MSRLCKAVSVLLLVFPFALFSYQVAAQAEFKPGGKLSGDSGFAAFKNDMQQGFVSYRDQVQKEAREFAALHEQISEGYENRIANVWAAPEQSSRTRWVLYEDNYTHKRVVDFEEGVIFWSTPEQYANVGFGLAEARSMLAGLMSVTRRQAFEQDEVASEVESKSIAEFEHLETAVLDNKPVLPAYLFGDSEASQARVNKAIDAMLASASKDQLSQQGQAVVVWTFPLTSAESATDTVIVDAPESAPMAKPTPVIAKAKPAPTSPHQLKPKTASQPKVASPPKTVQAPAPIAAAKPPSVWQTKAINAEQMKQLPARARPFVASINRENVEFKLSAELLLAIMETESAFNPMAKSPIPAFGLMQIVPGSAGQDATEKLFGKPRLLAPSYLFNPENNIRVGAAYFNILYYRYFRGIKDPLSRLHCAVAAYNTGPGNVSKALTGRSMALRPAIAIANAMSSDEVYAHLMSNLPYEETVNYLRKVNSRLAKYEEVLSDD